MRHIAAAGKDVFKGKNSFVFILLIGYMCLSWSSFFINVDYKQGFKKVEKGEKTYKVKGKKKISFIEKEKQKAKVLSAKLNLDPKSKPYKVVVIWFVFAITFGFFVYLYLFVKMLLPKNLVKHKEKEEQFLAFKQNFPFDTSFLIKGIIIFFFTETALKDIYFAFYFNGIELEGLSLFFSSLGINLLIFLLLVGSIKDVNVSFAKLYGFIDRNWIKLCFKGLFAYFAFVPIMIMLSLISYYLCNRVGVDIKPHQIASFVSEEKSPIVLGYWFFVAVFFAPFFEEIFFRGVIYRILLKKHSNILAVLVTSVIFSLLHFNASQFLVIFVMGVVLNSLYGKTKSLLPSMIFHTLNNTVSVTMLYYILVINR